MSTDRDFEDDLKMTANWKQVLIENVWKILTLHLLKMTGETPEVRSDERRRKRKRRKKERKEREEGEERDERKERE